MLFSRRPIQLPIGAESNLFAPVFPQGRAPVLR